jgi:hypothetical protein
MADIACGEGKVIHSLETQLACLEVFALGSRGAMGDGAETGAMPPVLPYLASFLKLRDSLPTNGLAEEGPPALFSWSPRSLLDSV